MQGELAAEIASELRATLSPEEKVQVETKPTQNPDAYVLYLKARGYESNPDRLFEDYSLAERLYRRSDPARSRVRPGPCAPLRDDRAHLSLV